MKRPSQKPEAPKTWLDQQLPRFKQYSEFALFIAGADFLLGYVSIVITSYRNKLGFIPPVQPQCLLAGAVPTMSILFMFAVNKPSAWLASYIDNWVDKPDNEQSCKSRKRFIKASYVIYIILSAIFIVRMAKSSTVVQSLLTTAIVLFFNLILANAALTETPKETEAKHGLSKMLQQSRGIQIDFKHLGDRIIRSQQTLQRQQYNFEQLHHQIGEQQDRVHELEDNYSQIDNKDPALKEAITNLKSEIEGHLQQIENSRNEITESKKTVEEDIQKNVIFQQEAKELNQSIQDRHQWINERKLISKRASTLWYQGYILYILFAAWPGIFQTLPQEFGGMRPRYAFVDVKKDSLSPETRQLLLPNPTAPDAVARSLPLAVYYENDGTLFVRRATDSTQTPVQEIKKDAIEGVTWRGYTLPLPAPKK